MEKEMLEFKDRIFELANSHFGVVAPKITKLRFHIKDQRIHIVLEIMIAGQDSVVGSLGNDTLQIYGPATNFIRILRVFSYGEVSHFPDKSFVDRVFLEQFWKPIMKMIYEKGSK